MAVGGVSAGSLTSGRKEGEDECGVLEKRKANWLDLLIQWQEGGEGTDCPRVMVVTKGGDGDVINWHMPPPHKTHHIRLDVVQWWAQNMAYLAHQRDRAPLHKAVKELLEKFPLKMRDWTALAFSQEDIAASPPHQWVVNAVNHLDTLYLAYTQETAGKGVVDWDTLLTQPVDTGLRTKQEALDIVKRQQEEEKVRTQLASFVRSSQSQPSQSHPSQSFQPSKKRKLSAPPPPQSQPHQQHRQQRPQQQSQRQQRPQSKGDPHPPAKRRFQGSCNNCGMLGHKASECRNPKVEGTPQFRGLKPENK